MINIKSLSNTAGKTGVTWRSACNRLVDGHRKSGDRQASETDDKNKLPVNEIKDLTDFSSPCKKPTPHLPRPVFGYTGCVAGEVGSALSGSL